MNLTLWEKLKLLIVGYIEIDKMTYVRCSIHGFSMAVVHGYMQYVECRTCLLDRLKVFDYENNKKKIGDIR